MSKIDIQIPAGARAVLVTPDGNGGFTQQPVSHGESVLNLKKDLLSHLTDFPHSDAWLEELRDYAEARLEARAAARGTNGLAIQRGKRAWQVIHGVSGEVRT